MNVINFNEGTDIPTTVLFPSFNDLASRVDGFVNAFNNAGTPVLGFRDGEDSIVLKDFLCYKGIDDN